VFSFWVSSTGAVAVLITAGMTSSLTSSERLQFQSFTKWRLDKTGGLTPQIESFCILTALLLHSC